MFNQDLFSEIVYNSILNGWRTNDSKIIQTFSNVFEKQLLNQLSKFDNKLTFICALNKSNEFKLSESLDIPKFDLNKPYQICLLLLTFKCFKWVVLKKCIFSLNDKIFPTISDIYLNNYDQEEFNNLALFINGKCKYEKIKHLKLEKIDVSGLLHILDERRLINNHTNFFMFVDKYRFMNDPEDKKDFVCQGIYKLFLSQQVHRYDIYDFIQYLSKESIEELEEKFKEETSEEETSEEDFKELIDDYDELIDILKKESNELRKINQKLKIKIQKKRELLNKYEMAINKSIKYLNKKDPYGKILIE